MKIPITFADLTHTSQNISSISFPLGISFVASYAKQKLEDRVSIDIFKYPDDFSGYLKNKDPKIACFSNFSWTLDISYEFAKRIKNKSPNTIVIFGGPNYPIEIPKQKEFLFSYPEIDFYIIGEGEQSFVKLFENLEKFNFDIKYFKKNQLKSWNCHYIFNEEMIIGETLPKIKNLDDMPSPYLSGLLDKFFDGVLNPIIQTTRGCPFTCTYCQEGQAYFNKISRFSKERIGSELEYIAKRVTVPNLMMADSNFTMYKQDIDTCKKISSIKQKFGWPKYFEISLGKDKKRALEALFILNENTLLSTPVQSTDLNVLENIHRKNIPMEQLIKIAKKGESYGANTFSEVILCLPGDSLESHFKSTFDMIDAGIHVVRSHQLLMLPGTEISSNRSREKYGIITRFRLQPRCFGNYKVYNEDFPACEIDEICVANSTMSYEDYLKCRSLDLTIELFCNNGIFQEPINFLQQQSIPASSFIKKINQNIPRSSLKELYNDFLKETNDCLWENRNELESFIKQPGMIEKYIKEEIRNNEQLKYRALAFFYRMNDLHKISFDSVKELLIKNGDFNEEKNQYLDELAKFSLSRKNNLLSLNETQTERFNYNFVDLLKNNFNGDFSSYRVPEGLNIEFFHSIEQKELMSKYLQQFGSSLNGLGIILSKSHVNKLYKKLKKVK